MAINSRELEEQQRRIHDEYARYLRTAHQGMGMAGMNQFFNDHARQGLYDQGLGLANVFRPPVEDRAAAAQRDRRRRLMLLLP